MSENQPNPPSRDAWSKEKEKIPLKNHYGKEAITVEGVYTATGQPKEFTTGWEDDFLKSFSMTGNIRLSADRTNVSPSMVRRRRQLDPDFAARFEEARLDATETLEAAAWMRARDGAKRTKVTTRNGLVVSEETVTEYSDTLLMFLLKANAPAKYRETINHQHSVDTAREKVKAMAEQEGLDVDEVMAEFNRIMGLG